MKLRICEKIAEYEKMGLVKHEFAEGNDFKTYDDILYALYDLFKCYERDITLERRKPFVTDEYENLVKKFAVSIVGLLRNEKEKYSQNASWNKLFSQRHMAWALFDWYDTSNSAIDYKDGMAWNEIYLGLADFYNQFYGKFEDNEQAIKLLCKYYPKEFDEDLRKHYKEIADALYTHIKNAGSSEDFGYAYGGLQILGKNIHNLPKELVIKVLNQYSLFLVLNQKVYRHQIFTIIDGSSFALEEKQKLKFFYLDSLFIINLLNIEMLRKEDGEVEPEYNFQEITLADSEIVVSQTAGAYWTNDNWNKRQFFHSGNLKIQVILEKKKIVIRREKKKKDIAYNYSDWSLESYRSREMEQQIRDFLNNKSSPKIDYGKMTFSLLYLENYRGIDSLEVELDHQFSFDTDTATLKKLTETENKIPDFYGKEVYSLSCIVGKNGTGKTSIVDFLRETFFKLIRVIDQLDVPCIDGIVKEEDYIEYGILDKNAKFLVVFGYDDEYYFLSNIHNVNIENVKVMPYRRWTFRSGNELSKIAYFSQQIRIDSPVWFEAGKVNERNSGKKEIAKALHGFRQCDFSETSNFAYNRNAMKVLYDKRKEWYIEDDNSKIINKELCYQIAFLYHMKPEEMRKYLDIGTEKKVVIYNLEDRKILEEIQLNDLYKKRAVIIQLVEKYAYRTEVAIGYFSSGQYAKFVFLARLFWFLGGYENTAGFINNIIGETVFYKEDVLQKNETALLFIDEGELYYHPEWQRCYLKELLGMIQREDWNHDIQIILTTNSPFILSDILREDVKYIQQQQNMEGETFAQNIHQLLRENFFLKYTIGEYSRERIENISAYLQQTMMEQKDTDIELGDYIEQSANKYEAFEHIINRIGEPVYRMKLASMLEEWQMARETPLAEKIKELEKKRNDLDMEIARLKEGNRA